MYIRQKGIKDDPEEKSVSPFSVLGLLQAEQKKYRRQQPDWNRLSPLIVLINILFYQRDREKKRVISEQGRIGISMEDLLYRENGPGKLLHLSRTAFYLYLDELSAGEYLDINRTAGLDMVYLKAEYLDILQIAQDYYKDRERQGRL